MGFWRVISNFFLTPTTVFVGVFVLFCFFLVIYYLVGACKGYGGASCRLLRLGRLDLRSRLVLLLSFSDVVDFF